MRKIYNKITLAWNEKTQRYDDVVYEDSFMYNGPMMLADYQCQCSVGLEAECYYNGMQWCTYDNDQWSDFNHDSANCNSSERCIGPCDFTYLVQEIGMSEENANNIIDTQCFEMQVYPGDTPGFMSCTGVFEGGFPYPGMLGLCQSEPQPPPDTHWACHQGQCIETQGQGYDQCYPGADPNSQWACADYVPKGTRAARQPARAKGPVTPGGMGDAYRRGGLTKNRMSKTLKGGGSGGRLKPS